MEELLELAERLGREIVKSQRYVDLKSAEEEIEEDKDATALFGSFVEENNRIAKLEYEGKPVEADDKRKLADLRQKVHSNERIQALVRCQADFAELMSKVNAKMREMLESPSKDEEGEES